MAILSTDRQVAAIKEPGRYACGESLYLQAVRAADETIRKSWLVRFRVSVLQSDGKLVTKPREAGLGSYPAVTLAKARDRAKQLRDGSKDYDPLEKRDDERKARLKAKLATEADAAKRVTFETLAKQYLADHGNGWKNEKHRKQWRSTLMTWAFPIIGPTVVSEIDVLAVLRVLQQPVRDREGEPERPLWEARTETASRLRQRIESVLNYGRVKLLREGDNPAAWATLKFTLPKRSAVASVEHHAAMAIDDMPDFMSALKTRDALAALALRFAILCAARTGEVLGATWEEIDLERATWSIPANRMKGRKPHRVPLSGAAMAVLTEAKKLSGDSGLIFSADGKALSNMAMNALLKRMGRDDITVHGTARSTFRDFIGERTSYSPELAEAALAHALGGKTHVSYQRGDLFDRRREMMETWAAFLAGESADNIVSFRAAS